MVTDVLDLERETIPNEDFRRMIFTGHDLQLVLMTPRFHALYGPPEHPDGTVHASKADAPSEH